jgi:enoyl-CoA hydratase/carnithine racemase
MQYTQLLLDVRDSVALITLNRPEFLNALNLELARDLMNATMECDGNRDVRAVVLTDRPDGHCVPQTHATHTRVSRWMALSPRSEA